jgi:hypothetical protein
MAELEGMIRYGMYPKEYSIAGDVAFAAQKVSSLRDQGMSAGEYLGQMGLFGDVEATSLTPTQVQLIALFDSKAPKKIREGLRNYVEIVKRQPQTGQGDISGIVRTKEDMLNEAINGFRPEQTGILGENAEVASPVLIDELARQQPAEEMGAVQPGEPEVPGVVEPIQGVEGQPALPAELATNPSELARLSRSADTQAKFDTGEAVPIDRAAEIKVDHADVLPVPEDVQAILDKADVFKFESHQSAKDYLNWIINGEKGRQPMILPRVKQEFDGDIARLREYAAQKARGVTRGKNGYAI